MRACTAVIKFALSTLLAVPLLLSANPALAWNGRGHMIVAAVAWTHMDPKTQKRAAALIKLNPSYPSWIVGVPKKDQAQIAFIIGATWPDLIKKFRGNCPKQPKPNSGPLYNYVYCNDTDDPSRSGASAGQNVGYTDPLEHKYWHFYDQPYSTDGTPTTAPVPPNAKTQIALLRTAIADNATPDALESYDMVWLEHMVGDVHQPLHAVQRYSADLPKGDIGGNAVCTGTHMGKDPKTGKPKCSSELHAFWDNAQGVQVSPGELPGLKKKKKAPAKIGIDAYNAYQAIDAAAALSAAPTDAVAVEDEGTWLNDSFSLATENAYRAPVGAGIGPYALDDAYTANTRKVTADQAELAGERLARLLDEHLH